MAFRAEAIGELERVTKQDKDEVARITTALKTDWHTAGLDAQDTALCVYAEKLTRSPAACGQADVDTLRAAGFNDTAIHDAAQVISYFNYINRIADGLGVDLEPEMKLQ